jgi:hypothetical protein
VVGEEGSKALTHFFLKKLMEKFVETVNSDEGLQKILKDPQYWGRTSVIRVLGTPGTEEEGKLIFEGAFALIGGKIEILNDPPPNPRTRIYLSEDLLLDLLEGKDPREIMFHEEFYASGDHILTDLVLWRKMLEPYSYIFEKVRAK